MKLFMVPCFVVVSANSADEADDKVSARLQTVENTRSGAAVYFDEVLPTKEVPDEEHHTILDYYQEEFKCDGQ